MTYLKRLMRQEYFCIIESDTNRQSLKEIEPVLQGLGGAMVSALGYAICKDLGSSPTYGQWSFLPVTWFLHSTIESER